MFIFSFYLLFESKYFISLFIYKVVQIVNTFLKCKFSVKIFSMYFEFLYNIFSKSERIANMLENDQNLINGVKEKDTMNSVSFFFYF